jgi:hypothetical protein
MDSLSALHPVVLKKLFSPPFEYSAKGLTFNSHPREAVADLKQGLFPKRRISAPQQGLVADAAASLWHHRQSIDEERRTDCGSQRRALERAGRPSAGSSAARAETGAEIFAGECGGERRNTQP